MLGFKRKGLRHGGPPVTSATLQQSYDRRSFVIGAVQGGIGVLLAVRMAYIAVAENERYRVLAESNRVNLSLISRIGCSLLRGSQFFKCRCSRVSHLAQIFDC